MSEIILNFVDCSLINLFIILKKYFYFWMVSITFSSPALYKKSIILVRA